LHVTNATAILVRRRRNAETHRTVTVAPEWGPAAPGDVGVDLSLCPAICPNLPYTEIFVSYAINDEPIIVRMH